MSTIEAPQSEAMSRERLVEVEDKLRVEISGGDDPARLLGTGALYLGACILYAGREIAHAIGEAGRH